jgi:hypothetical protein
VKCAIFSLALLTITAAVLGGQQPAPTAKAHEESLHWLVDGAQELDGKDRIAVTTALTPGQRAAIIEAIAALLRPGNKIGDTASEKRLLDAVIETRVKLVDLNGDGISEVIAQASDDESCSPTGNCMFWVFARSGNGYKPILERIATQTFAIRHTRTNGFNDLILGQHGSATASGLFLYRFANGSYREGPCYSANWERLVGDEVQELKDPVITPCERGSAQKR